MDYITAIIIVGAIWLVLVAFWHWCNQPKQSIPKDRRSIVRRKDDSELYYDAHRGD